MGRASEGRSAFKAAQSLAELKKAATTGEGPCSLAEKRKLAGVKREDERQQEGARARDRITLKDSFYCDYLPFARVTQKLESIHKTEEHVKNWLGPVVGHLP